MATLTRVPGDYAEALRHLGNRPGYRAGHNTRVVREGYAGLPALRYHDTDVVTYHPDGSLVLDSGGWRTVTTKDRLNQVGAVRVWSERSVWYVGWHSGIHAFADGIRLYPDGRVEGADPDPRAGQRERAAIRRYADRYMMRLAAGTLGSPGPGDCWDCALRDMATGKPMGDGKPEHLRSHLAERYYVPSLVVNAMEAMGSSMMGRYWVSERFGGTPDPNPSTFERRQVHKALTRYLLRALGHAA